MGRDQRMIIPITNSGYGVGEKGKFCTEETPLRPISLYGTAKVEAEKIALERGNAISFRLATVFGMAPRMRIDLLVNDFVYRAVNDRAVVLFEAHFKRNYIHIRDVARAFMHGDGEFRDDEGRALQCRPVRRQSVEGRAVRAHQEAAAALRLLEAAIGEDPDKRDYIVSNAKIEGTGFQPAFSLDAGITELIKGYRMLRNTVYGNI